MGSLCGIRHLKCMLEMIKAGNGPYDRSQIWDRIDARFSLSQGAAVAVFMAVWRVLCLICVLNVCLVCFGPGMAVDCGFTK